MTVVVTFAAPQIAGRPHVLKPGNATVSDSRAHHPAAIVSGKVVGQHLRRGVPVSGREVHQEAFGHLACRVFQPSWLWL